MTKRSASAESIPHPISRKSASPSREAFGTMAKAESLVVGDTNTVPDSEAMNLPDDPHRVSTQGKNLVLSGNTFDYGFAPFSITLLEIQLARR